MPDKERIELEGLAERIPAICAVSDARPTLEAAETLDFATRELWGIYWSRWVRMHDSAFDVIKPEKIVELLQSSLDSAKKAESSSVAVRAPIIERHARNIAWRLETAKALAEGNKPWQERLAEINILHDRGPKKDTSKSFAVAQ